MDNKKISVIVKIRFPNPSDMSIEDWFEQTELCVFHAKKAYDKLVKDLEKPEDVSIYFSYPNMARNKKFEELLNLEEIPYEDSQDIELVISY